MTRRRSRPTPHAALGRRRPPRAAWSLALTAPLAAAQPAPADDAPERWNIHAQTTYVWQRKPAFRSPYEGPNSLRGARETSYSFTATLGLGLRLGPRTELHVDPEVAQGVAFSGLVGLGGFSNGELARTSGATPTFYRARLLLRHVVGLGGAQGEPERIDGAMNQLASVYPAERLVFTLGNLSVLDLFDANRYSHDPRTQFMNWTLMTHGAYDYAADARGYSWGAAVEYVAPGWALRAGRFAQPRDPNGLKLDRRIGRHYGDQVELQVDHTLVGQPGATRWLAFRNRARMARYDDALALAAADNGGVPDIDAVRGGERSKTGVGVNLEQSLGADLGVFARAMRADGATETYAFTEVDRSASAGALLRGARWGRPDDTVGVGYARNALSVPHRQVLERGGSTFFLGDGRLNYRAERIAEAYYSVGLARGVWLTFDVQRIVNPGYNADRGPANFYAVRLHAER